jgi:hypothetical protein
MEDFHHAAVRLFVGLCFVFSPPPAQSVLTPERFLQCSHARASLPPSTTQFHNHPDFDDPVGLFAVFDGEWTMGGMCVRARLPALFLQHPLARLPL